MGVLKHVKGVDLYSGCYRESLFTIQVIPRSILSPLPHCQVQGDHLQLPFFKYFEIGFKFMKRPKPRDKNNP